MTSMTFLLLTLNIFPTFILCFHGLFNQKLKNTIIVVKIWQKLLPMKNTTIVLAAELSIPPLTKKVFTETCLMFKSGAMKKFESVIFLFKWELCSFNPIRDGLFWGCPRMRGKKRPSPLKSVKHILQWWDLAQLYLA